MRPAEARDYFRKLVQSFFGKADVIFGRQSHRAKPEIPLVSLTPGNVKRTRDCCGYSIDGVPVYCYPSSLNITIDLFTHGDPILQNGEIVAWDDNAVDELTMFADFLGSQHVIEWCNRYDMSVTIDGDVQSLTALVNDTAYEYRARLSVWLNFVQTSEGNTALLKEDSILYPTTNPDTGEEEYAPFDPETSVDKPDESKAIIVPSYDDSSNVGGTETLAFETSHVFETVEIINEQEEYHEQ